MPVEINNKANRAELRTYFARNAIPTEANFADLIDGVLNQRDDGVAKPTGGPLSLAPTTSDQKGVLDLYDNFGQTAPSWSIGLNVLESGARRTGLAFSDSRGLTRLFIEATSGRVGVGTASPQATLDVAGPIHADSAQKPIRIGSEYTNFSRTDNLGAEIANDTRNYRSLMIVGNRSLEAGVRRVSVWDRLDVNGTLTTTARLGVGVNRPADSLDVANDVRLNSSRNPIRITSRWSAFPDSITNGAEISNDTGTFRTLMIVGNKSQNNTTRRVSIWDRLEVNGTLRVTGRIEQAGWQNVSYANGWTRYSGSWQNASYFRDTQGMVHLRGMIKAPASGNNKHAFTLPPGYRPTMRILMASISSAQPGSSITQPVARIDVLSNGQVVIRCSDTRWVSLHGLTFRAA